MGVLLLVAFDFEHSVKHLQHYLDELFLLLLVLVSFFLGIADCLLELFLFLFVLEVLSVVISVLLIILVDFFQVLFRFYLLVSSRVFDLLEIVLQLEYLPLFVSHFS